MGVANIPEQQKEQSRESHNEWIDLMKGNGKMETSKGKGADFITVVSVGNQGETSHPENFVTVLSIGSGMRKDDEAQLVSKTVANGVDPHLEEEVEVYRLPGERLGFGLKFEGGNKTSERVKRLFIQSCADQSPASRTKCTWGCLGEGDEILSIDGVPVILMTRLDCVRRLKESQLVIKLMVRCRGALRPEVVSAERKTTLLEKNKVPPELPLAPPPVPPRKLRHPRGLADGEANPSPVKKSWDSAKSVPTSQNGSPQSQSSFLGSSNGNSNSSSSNSSIKSSAYESCYSSPKSGINAKNESPKALPKDYSSDLCKFKQEPPEATVYLDARIQDTSSTHGSTSDETSSSLSTVVDRFSTSDRVSTISTASTASIAGSEQYATDNTKGNHHHQHTNDHCNDNNNNSSSSNAKEFQTDGLNLKGMLTPLDQLDFEFTTNPPDYLLTRLANSEAVTHVESRGDVERVTAVVAPNTVLIEETITLQPPLSFQDAPLSYGHELSPGIFYTDLAADSKTHFRPIKDDASLVESIVNGDVDHHRLRRHHRQDHHQDRNHQDNHLNPHHNHQDLHLNHQNNQDNHDDPLIESVDLCHRDPLIETINHHLDPLIEAVNHHHHQRLDPLIDIVDQQQQVNSAPPLPIRNHVNRIPVNQPISNGEIKSSKNDDYLTEKIETPILPPKPMPRKDLKTRRKRPPPPPPPPNSIPRRQLPSAPESINHQSNQSEFLDSNLENGAEIPKSESNGTKTDENNSISQESSKFSKESIKVDDEELIEVKNGKNTKNPENEVELNFEEELKKDLKNSPNKLNFDEELQKELKNSPDKLNFRQTGSEVNSKGDEMENLPTGKCREEGNLLTMSQESMEGESGKFPTKEMQTNKLLDIIEMKIKMSDEIQHRQSSTISDNTETNVRRISENAEEEMKRGKSNFPGKFNNSPLKGKLVEMTNKDTVSFEVDDSESEKEEEREKKEKEVKGKEEEIDKKWKGKRKEGKTEIELEEREEKRRVEEVKRENRKEEEILNGKRREEEIRREKISRGNIEEEIKPKNRREKIKPENRREEIKKEKEKINKEEKSREKSYKEERSEEKLSKDEKVKGKLHKEEKSKGKLNKDEKCKGKLNRDDSRNKEINDEEKRKVKREELGSRRIKEEGSEENLNRQVQRNKERNREEGRRENIKKQEQRREEIGRERIKEETKTKNGNISKSENNNTRQEIRKENKKEKIENCNKEKVDQEFEEEKEEEQKGQEEQGKQKEQLGQKERKELEKQKEPKGQKELKEDGKQKEQKEQKGPKEQTKKKEEKEHKGQKEQKEQQQEISDLSKLKKIVSPSKDERTLSKECNCFVNGNKEEEEESEANSVVIEEINDGKLIINETPIERLENICSDVENLAQEIEIKRCYKREELMDDDDDDDDTSEESDAGDYYWQSNLATIGEEEETNSLEYNNANKEVNDLEEKAEAEKDKPNIPSVVVREYSKNVRDEVDAVRQIAKDFGTEDKKPDKSPVNGRMDNCEGGQRLPPDGDEFPAAYQEFTNPDQYQFVATTNLSTMTTNGNLICQNQTFLTTENYHPKANNNSKSIEKIHIVSQCVVDHIVNDQKYKPKPIVISERKIEIAGYYPKEVPSIMDSPFKPDNPPPLPLTEPPKVDNLSLVRNNSEQTRKFSSNGELWRQDDKSERSVRDKIAMFSSQSNIEVPLFPNQSTNTTNNTTPNGRKLSKHKSSDDVFADEKTKATQYFSERTQSSFDISTTDGNQSTNSPTNSPTFNNESSNQQNSAKYIQRPPSLPKTSPPIEDIFTTESKNSTLSEEKQYSTYATKTYTPKNIDSSIDSGFSKSFDSTVKNSPPTLVRATSFSGAGTCFNHERPQTSNQVLSTSQISRTNSLVSTFRKPGEELRRSSLNQLIEQRRKGISKLRGLVIPEKDAVPVDQAIIDLPEIKSRDSILINQVPKSSIQDKWGSQSSLASNTSTVSTPMKATTSFKMPAPQILSKYSPAFKRKSLSVYSTPNTISPSNYNTNCNNSNPKMSQTINSTLSEAPKSLESICSPTRSDYSFEYLSSTGSPENLRSRPRIGQKKTRTDYDDSDNDSAVSSSQSSISRGFSPPMSPVPSDRNYITSEMNYQRRTLIIDPLKNDPDGNCFSKPIYSISSDKCEFNKNSQIPQRQIIKRTNSTDSSSSSTLTTGSQIAESLSRRVLKPQSVEAINRKNILASAKCRSGRDLNGSPLIQRKFSDDEETPEGGNVDYSQKVNGNGETKIAYIETVQDDEQPIEKVDEPKLPPKRSIPQPVGRPPKPESLEPSNDLKMWVRSEVKNLADKISSEKTMRTGRSRSSLTLDDQTADDILCPRNRTSSNELDETDKNAKFPQKNNNETDLLTILTTKSRSRSAIHVEESSYGKSRSQMSLEDILTLKNEPKLTRTQSVTIETTTSLDRNGIHLEKSIKHETDTKSPARRSNSSDWNEERTFPSKIPSLNRPKVTNNSEDLVDISEKPKNLVSKIPTSKSLGRRSASVTDMKKAFEKTDSPNQSGAITTLQTGNNVHNRFPSLDSSVEENIRPVGVEGDAERFCIEQFGSISSLASSTSLISQQELAQLVEEASLEEARGSHDVIVVLLHKENPSGSVGITLAGGIDCEAKEITVHRVLSHSIADKDGRVQRGDRILSINGRSTRGLSHRESLSVLKQPRSEVVLVVSRARIDEGCKLRTRTESVETIVEGYEMNGGIENTAWGPPSTIAIHKDGAGLGFSLEGGRDSPLGDRPLIIKKIFTGGAAEKTGALKAGDQLLEVNGNDVTRMSRIEAWSLMKKLHDGEVNLLVRHPATKSS
ncbi:uncharacterized protein LOC122501268 [Leptopilina heterotoma]|uniref:uncharacterized protein LOC122501268 n=1 Tax=Leptopilina heterotoma TaxID=63436 RepID=UPI001CA87455|nr:uncharacterized protein LOC122501268 [Leptopilina heterotoma]